MVRTRRGVCVVAAVPSGPNGEFKNYGYDPVGNGLSAADGNYA